MAVSFTSDGARIRVEWLPPLLRQLASIIFLAPALYLAYYLALGIRQDFFGDGDFRDIPGLLVFVLITLVVAILGYVLATLRYFVDIDKTSGEVIVRRPSPAVDRSP